MKKLYFVLLLSILSLTNLTVYEITTETKNINAIIENANIKGGDQIIFHKGEYEIPNIVIEQKISSETPIIIKAVDGEKVTISSESDKCIQIKQSENIYGRSNNIKKLSSPHC